MLTETIFLDKLEHSGSIKQCRKIYDHWQVPLYKGLPMYELIWECTRERIGGTNFDPKFRYKISLDYKKRPKVIEEFIQCIMIQFPSDADFREEVTAKLKKKIERFEKECLYWSEKKNICNKGYFAYDLFTRSISLIEDLFLELAYPYGAKQEIKEHY